MGPTKEIVFEGNRYFGNHIDAPEDAVVARRKAKPVLDWNEPEFDPAHPEGFDRFIGRASRVDETAVRRPVWQDREY